MKILKRLLYSLLAGAAFGIGLTFVVYFYFRDIHPLERTFWEPELVGKIQIKDVTELRRKDFLVIGAIVEENAGMIWSKVVIDFSLLDSQGNQVEFCEGIEFALWPHDSRQIKVQCYLIDAEALPQYETIEASVSYAISVGRGGIET